MKKKQTKQTRQTKQYLERNWNKFMIAGVKARCIKISESDCITLKELTQINKIIICSSKIINSWEDQSELLKQEE